MHFWIKVVHVGSVLVDMYVKCGSFENAFGVMEISPQKDLVLWNTLITGCAQNHFAREALQLFFQMLEDGLQLDQVTMSSALKACSTIKDLEQGELIHFYSVEQCFEKDVVVGNAIIDMYAKCGHIEAAVNVFEGMPKRDAATWCAITAGCTHDEKGHMTVELFPRMEMDGILPDRTFFLCVLKACTTSVAFHQGKLIHAYFLESGDHLTSDLLIANTFIDMYMKCGSYQDAMSVFDGLQNRDLVTWNTVIGGFVQSSDLQLILKYYRLLQEDGYRPDSITFISLLCACNHLGLVELALHHFNSMVSVYGISPAPEHYNCVIDLLSQGGHLKEAEDFILSSPMQSDAVGWASLLNQSRHHENLTLARRCFNNFTSLKGRNATGFLSISRALPHDQWDGKAGEIEALRSFSNSWKKPGIACIATDHELHAFRVNNVFQEQGRNAFFKMKRIFGFLKAEGEYFPHVEFCVQAMEE